MLTFAKKAAGKKPAILLKYELVTDVLQRLNLDNKSTFFSFSTFTSKTKIWSCTKNNFVSRRDHAAQKKNAFCSKELLLIIIFFRNGTPYRGCFCNLGNICLTVLRNKVTCKDYSALLSKITIFFK